VVATDGTEREVDTIIFGTGFHVTDMPIAKVVRDGDGRSLAEHWADGIQAHRGTTVAGFPNLFLLLGPNTGLGHNSVVFMAETQADYVIRALRFMDSAGPGTLEVNRDAQLRWDKRMQDSMEGTVWTAGGCSSWYLERSGRNATLWPDYSYRFRQALSEFDPAEYTRRAPSRTAPADPARERVAA